MSIFNSFNSQRHLLDVFAYPGYSELAECREVVDDCLAGQKTIQEKKSYLPPNKYRLKHPEQYVEYLQRALFPGETKYALDIYEGLFSIGNPKITLPANDRKMSYIISEASVYKDSLKDIQMRLNREQMTHGLRCLLLETRMSEDKPFYLQEYCASKFLRSHFISLDGESVADFILLDESTYEYDMTKFIDVPICRIRILGLDKNNEYYQRSIQPGELKDGFDAKNPPLDEGTIYPSYLNRRFNRIPFVWCGADNISGSSLSIPPMLPMAQTEIALYKAMADHAYHIYMNTQEVLCISGAPANFDPDSVEIGAGACISFRSPDTKVYYASTNGTGFTAEENQITQLKNDIEQKRLSLMSAKTHQSGTVVGLVQNSQSAPLRCTVDTSGTAITQILRYMATWMGYSDSDVASIEYLPSKQFANPKVNIAEFISLCEAVYTGQVQMLESDLYNMARESGYINSSLTWEKFKAKYNIEEEERRRNQSILPSTTGNPFKNTDNSVSTQDSTKSSAQTSTQDNAQNASAKK